MNVNLRFTESSEFLMCVMCLISRYLFIIIKPTWFHASAVNMPLFRKPKFTSPYHFTFSTGILSCDDRRGSRRIGWKRKWIGLLLLPGVYMCGGAAWAVDWSTGGKEGRGKVAGHFCACAVMPTKPPNIVNFLTSGKLWATTIPTLLASLHSDHSRYNQ